MSVKFVQIFLQWSKMYNENLFGKMEFRRYYDFFSPQIERFNTILVRALIQGSDQIKYFDPFEVGNRIGIQFQQVCLGGKVEKGRRF